MTSFTSHIARQKRIAKRSARKRERNDARSSARFRGLRLGDDTTSPPSTQRLSVMEDKWHRFLSKEQRSRQKRSRRFDRRLDLIASD